MLKLSLVVMFVLSLATLSFAASFAPAPMVDQPVPVATAEPHMWVETFE
jgi:hypothetical protein